VSTGITDRGAAKTLVAGTRIRLSFMDGTLGVFAGCNSGSGSYSIVDGALHADAFTMTEMACDDDRMAQDDWAVAVLVDRPLVTLDRDTLTLATDTVTLVLKDHEIVDPDRPLVGTLWKGTTLIDGDAASTSAAIAAVRMRFGTDGRVAVDTGCNSGHASYEATASDISFGSLGLTRMACDGDRTAVEQHVVAVLDGGVDYTIESASLTLTNGDIGLGLVADE
jgi:heat shock protein HslJ